MTNTEIRRANVKTLRKEAKRRDIDIDGMTRADLVEVLLAPEKPVEKESPIATVELVVMRREDGLEANVHPDMVEDYKLGGYVKV